MGLIDKVASRAERVKPGPSNFFDRLSPDVQLQFLEIRRQFLAGELQVSANKLADILHTTAAEEGIETCGVQGLRVWLGRRDS